MTDDTRDTCYLLINKDNDKIVFLNRKIMLDYIANHLEEIDDDVQVELVEYRKFGVVRSHEET